jgi:hypothetical protein
MTIPEIDGSSTRPQTRDPVSRAPPKKMYKHCSRDAWYLQNGAMPTTCAKSLAATCVAKEGSCEANLAVVEAHHWQIGSDVA